MTAFDATLLKQIVHRFLHRECEITGPVGGGFSRAVVFQVQTELGLFALRGLPTDELPRSRIEELHHYLEFLQRQSLPIAVPIPGDWGTTVHCEHGRFWQLEPWLSGAPLIQGNITAAQLAQVMTTLARLHMCSARYTATVRGRDWFNVRSGPCPALVQRRELLDSWTNERVTTARQQVRGLSSSAAALCQQVIEHWQRLGPLIRRELVSLEPIQFPLHPCWRDLWREHVLWTGETVTGLIDPLAARTDHPATDLSRLLGTLVADEREHWRRALDVYGAIRPLTIEEQRLVPVLDRSGVLLSGLYWIDRWLRGEASSATDLRTLERLRFICHRLRSIDATG